MALGELGLPEEDERLHHEKKRITLLRSPCQALQAKE